MKKGLSYFLIVAFIFIAGAQDLSQPLPIDQSIKKGVLPNGMTYYIKSTDVVKGAASYYIIQNVGSILEDDNQRGLAHFLEHMAFNGTKHFPGKGILNTLQSYGAVFGKDINAYTSFDETVYNLSDIPTKDGLVDTCLTILQDWSNYLLLTEEEIDAERGVIKEEWRARQNGNMRLYEASLPITYNNSKYATRMPIGLMSIVEGFEYKALRDFYHDWYRTDLQAIAVIGDVDQDEIEKKIIEKFSKIPAVDNPKERFVVNIPDHKGMMFNYGTDPEVTSPSISFGIRHPKSPGNETTGDLRRYLLESMAVRMLSSRIFEKGQKPEASFTRATVGYGGFGRTSKMFSVNINPKPDKQKEAFHEVMTEINRAVKHGYAPSEIDRAMTRIKTSYENQIAKKDDQSHKSIEGAIQNNYLSNIAITDVEKEYEIVKQLLENISPEDIHNTIKELYTKDNRVLNVTGVDGLDNLTEAQAIEILSQVENDKTLLPYSEELEGKTLLSDLEITPGSIVNIVKNEDLGATSYQLSNGVKVHYKYVNKQKDQVSLNAVSYGGTSLLDDNDLPSAGLVNSLVSRSGLVNYNSVDLRKILAGKTARVSVSLNGITESVSGSSNTKDVETMLQMVYAYFVEPRFDEDAFKVMEGNLDIYLEKRSKDVNEKKKDSMLYTLYGANNPRKRIFNKAYLDDISFSRIKDIYLERFANVSDFEFFIVGDVEEEHLKPLLLQYIASVPSEQVTETFNDDTVEWIANKIDKDIFVTMEDPKATINIVYKKEMPYSKESAIYSKALGDILQLRVTETVRESEGGAYSPYAGSSISREPKSVASVSFYFDCNPDMADKLADIVKNEFKKIANGIINDVDLEKIRSNFIKEREQAKDNNSFDMQMLKAFYIYGEDMNDPKNFEDIVNKMTVSDIQDMAQEIYNSNQSYQIIFKPKQ